MNISEYLVNSLSLDQHVRQVATAALEKASSENYPVYLQLLCSELASETQQSHIRVAAGVAIKNSLIAKELSKKAHLAERWVALDSAVKTSIKGLVLKTLATRDGQVGMVAAQIIAGVAQIELPRGEWPELTQILLQNVASPASPPSLKKATLEALGFVCEQIDPIVLASKSNEILTAVVQGASLHDEGAAPIRKAAIVALANSLEFVRGNFDNEAERNHIMSVVFDATQAKEDVVAVAAFECMINILSLYYQYMAPYMNKGLFNMTIECMKHPNERIVLQAIEFWSTICDEEIDRQIDREDGSDVVIFYFAKASLPYVLPTLLTLLAKQESEDDEDDWNVSKAACTCLSLLANCVQDDIVGPSNNTVISFVEQNVMAHDWRHREAAVMAFASILDGPRPELLSPYILQALPLLTSMLRDPSIAVRDTSAWAISRICEIMHMVIPEKDIPGLLGVFIEGLKEPPRVASHYACSIMNLAAHLGSEDTDQETNIISGQFSQICTALFAATQRGDADESNLRSVVYQAISNVILYSARDAFEIIRLILNTVLDQLNQSLVLQSQKVNFDDEMKISDIQSHLCNVLQSIIKKIGASIKPYTERMMTIFMLILSSASASRAVSIYEDMLLTVGSVVAETEADFAKFVPAFLPKLLECIRSHGEQILCSIAVGLVGDLARALGKDIEPYMDALMSALFEAIQDPALHRSAKSHIISAFGDLAMAIGFLYAKYLQPVMSLLEQACSLQVNKDNPDDVEYLNELRESILEAFTCIVQGMKADNRADVIFEYAEMMTHFIMFISQDEDATETESRNAIGLLGDLTDTFGARLKPKLTESWVKPFVKEFRRPEKYTESTINIANWTHKIISQV